MKMIIDTDIGRDPDDFFSLLYFLAAGVDIKLVCISPGDKDQVAVAHLIRDQLGLDFPIGVGKKDRDKKSSGGVHYKMLDRYKYPKEREADGYGPDLIKSVYAEHPDSDVFIIGPPMSIGGFLKENKVKIHKATMQGGFLPYSLKEDYEVPLLDKFVDQEKVATFNMNGDVKGTFEFLAADVFDRRFVGKNVCHTIVYDKDIHKKIKPILKEKNRAGELFVEAMDIYLSRHDSKKFHDPAAAVSHLHPNVFGWVFGGPIREKGKWGTDPEGSDLIAANVDYDKLWYHIARGE
jgi:inosine-uridine nucleoside N-ribohydrolase